MDVLEAIRKRRSVRAFKTDPIPSDALDAIIESALWAPSAGNLQARDFIIVKDRQVKGLLSQAALGQSFIEEAPVNIIVCANQERSARRYGERGRRLYCIQDASAAIQNILLAAHALGIGSCWVGAFDEGRVARVLGLPEYLVPVAIIPIGYPAESPSAPRRMMRRECVHYERYGVRQPE
jgi:nitroreductase